MWIEVIGCLFISIMATIFVFDFQKWLIRKINNEPKLTETEIWTREYQRDVPTVWTTTDTQ